MGQYVAGIVIWEKMVSTTIRLLFILILIFAGSIQASAEKRVALIIGNTNYEHVPRLINPENDANDLAKEFTRIGFQVTTELNLSKDAMEKALANFSDRANGADFAAIFFAGHGMEMDKKNYLIPIDARLATDTRVRFETVALEDVTGALEGVKGIKMVMLDACRNNPFAPSMTITRATRRIGRGFSRVEPVSGSIVSFAAREGTIAEDGEGRNSPYTKALIEQLRVPGLDIRILFAKVRDAVLSATGNRQQPFHYASLPGTEIRLFGNSQQGSSEVFNKNSVLEEWKSIQNSNNIDVLNAFVQAHNNTRFALYAKARVESIRQKLKLKTTIGPPDADGVKQLAVPLVVDSELIRNIQQSLNELGYKAGLPDGKNGPNTHKAIRAYQKQNNLVVTGVINQALFTLLNQTEINKKTSAYDPIGNSLRTLKNYYPVTRDFRVAKLKENLREKKITKNQCTDAIGSAFEQSLIAVPPRPNKPTGIEFSQISSLMNRANTALLLGYNNKALALMESVEDALPSAWGYSRGGVSFYLAGYYHFIGLDREAKKALSRGRRDFGPSPRKHFSSRVKPYHEAHNSVGLALNARMRGDFRNSEKHFQAALKYMDKARANGQIANYSSKSFLQWEISKDIAKQGRIEDGEALVLKTLAEENSYRPKLIHALLLSQLSEFRFSLGQYEDAAWLTRKAIDIYLSKCARNTSIYLNLAYLTLAKSLVANQRWDEALRIFERVDRSASDQFLTRISNLSISATADKTIALLYLGDFNGAFELIDQVTRTQNLANKGIISRELKLLKSSIGIMQKHYNPEFSNLLDGIVAKLPNVKQKIDLARRLSQLLRVWESKGIEFVSTRN